MARHKPRIIMTGTPLVSVATKVSDSLKNYEIKWKNPTDIKSLEQYDAIIVLSEKGESNLKLIDRLREYNIPIVSVFDTYNKVSGMVVGNSTCFNEADEFSKECKGIPNKAPITDSDLMSHLKAGAKYAVKNEISPYHLKGIVERTLNN